MRLVCASANPKKVAEIARLLPAWVELLPRPHEVGDVEENAPTLEGNAAIKAVEIANFAHEWALADDTGLLVDALSGEPGVRSARYAGDHAGWAKCILSRANVKELSPLVSAEIMGLVTTAFLFRTMAMVERLPR